MPVYNSLNLLLKLDKLGFQPSKQGRLELRYISVYDSWILVLKLYKLGFKPSKRGRQELPGLIFQSIIVNFSIKPRYTGIQTQ